MFLPLTLQIFVGLAVVDHQLADIEANKSVATHSAAALVDIAAGARKSTKGKGAKKAKKGANKRTKKSEKDLIADFVKKIQKRSLDKKGKSKSK
jgi:hypothetical protein